MNKKFLICGAIATALFVSACVKKEEPKQEEKPETAQAASEPSQFENLPSVEQNAQQQAEIPPHVEIERTESANLSTEIRRESAATHEAHATTQQAETQAADAKPAKAESVKAETSQTQTAAAPKAPAPKASGAAQSEDDAVAAAIAAATPALKN